MWIIVGEKYDVRGLMEDVRGLMEDVRGLMYEFIFDYIARDFF